MFHIFTDVGRIGRRAEGVKRRQTDRQTDRDRGRQTRQSDRKRGSERE